MLFDLIDAVMAEGLGISVDAYKKGVEKLPNDAVDKIGELILDDGNNTRAREIWNKYQ